MENSNIFSGEVSIEYINEVDKIKYAQFFETFKVNMELSRKSNDTNAIANIVKTLKHYKKAFII